MNVPGSKDVIIPDPSFDICDMMSFECVYDDSANPFPPSKQPVELGTLQSNFSEFVHSINLNPSLVPLYSVIIVF